LKIGLRLILEHARGYATADHDRGSEGYDGGDQEQRHQARREPALAEIHDLAHKVRQATGERSEIVHVLLLR
jgi:hypothetical protein